MATYGTRVLDQVKPTKDGGYDVTMKDGHRVSLSPAEMSQAKRGAEFKGDDSPEKAYATLCFAAMAKRGQAEGFRRAGADRSYQSTIDRLDTGAHIRDTARLLGLKDRIAPYKPGVPSFVAESKAHAVFIHSPSNSRWAQDRWGTRIPYDKTDGIGHLDKKGDSERHVLRDWITFSPDAIGRYTVPAGN
jgi:hypothetical protein